MTKCVLTHIRVICEAQLLMTRVIKIDLPKDKRTSLKHTVRCLQSVLFLKASDLRMGCAANVEKVFLLGRET